MEFQRQKYLDKLISKKDNGRIKVITGIRKCGKSYLLFNLYKDYLLSFGVTKNQIIKIALDEFEDRNLFNLNKAIEDKIVGNKKY